LAQALKDQWNEAYGWLPESERRRLIELAKNILNIEADTFQQRLEESSFRLISHESVNYMKELLVAVCLRGSARSHISSCESHPNAARCFQNRR